MSDILKWAPLVKALAAKYTARWSDRYEFDDFAQEGYLAVLKAYENFDPSKSPTPEPCNTYMYTWIDKSMQAYIRASWKVERIQSDGYNEEMSADKPIWDSVASEIDLARILTELRPLTERDQKLLHMRYKEDMTLKAIAEIEGVSFQAIDSRLRRLTASIKRGINE